MLLKITDLYDLPPGVAGNGQWASLHTFQIATPHAWALWDKRERDSWVLHIAVLGHIDRTYRERPASLEFDYEVVPAHAH